MLAPLCLNNIVVNKSNLAKHKCLRDIILVSLAGQRTCGDLKLTINLTLLLKTALSSVVPLNFDIGKYCFLAVHCLSEAVLKTNQYFPLEINQILQQNMARPFATALTYKCLFGRSRWI